MRKFILAIFVVLLVGNSNHIDAFVGDWHSYTNKEHVTCMVPFGGQLFVGTSGGIRNINTTTFEEKSYTNLDGLVEVSIVAMTKTSTNQLWAASRSGFLYEWNGTKWQTFGRSYVTERWRPNLRAMISMGKYLVLGTDKGLTFFDLEKKVASVNLTKFFDKSNVKVLSLIQKGDSLFIGTEVGVYKTAIDGGNILSDRYESIFDPKSWVPVDARVMQDLPKPVLDPKAKNDSDSTEVLKADTIPNPYRFLVFNNEQLETYPQGIVQHTPVPIKMILGKPVEIAQKSYKNLSGFDNFVLIGNNLFLSGPNIFAVISNFDQSTPSAFSFINLSNSELPSERVFNIVSTKSNTYILTQYSLFQKDNERWKNVPGYYIYSEEMDTRSLRNLAADQNGNVFIGSWGFGIFKINGVNVQQWDAKNTPCMDTAVNNFTVIQSTAQVYRGGLWTVTFKAEKAQAYQLVFLDILSGKVSCPILNAKGNTIRHIKVLSDDVVGVAGDAGTDLYTYDRSGEIRMNLWKTLRREGSSESWDVEMDGFGRVWNLIAGQLMYADSLDQSAINPRLKLLEGFDGKECRQMEKDILSSFWIGCVNGLYHFSPALVIDSSKIKRYTQNDGLLSTTISDLSVNKETGQIWMATDLGISMYESGIRLTGVDASNVKAYPNPFRSIHQVVAIDNIPSGMSVSIFNQSGNIVRRFEKESIKGGQCQWDGTNSSGIKVTPGIYSYSVFGSGRTHLGKIIVAR